MYLPSHQRIGLRGIANAGDDIAGNRSRPAADGEGVVVAVGDVPANRELTAIDRNGGAVVSGDGAMTASELPKDRLRADADQSWRMRAPVANWP